jgi:hypothetical protein
MRVCPQCIKSQSMHGRAVLQQSNQISDFADDPGEGARFAVEPTRIEVRHKRPKLTFG